MARKKGGARSHQQKRQRKQQRSAQRAHRRQARGAGRIQQSQIKEIARLLQELDLVAPNGELDESRLEATLELGLDSDDLATEVEFEAVEIDPIEAMAAFIGEAEALGISPDQLAAESAGEDGEQQFEILQRVAKDFYDDALRDQILTALAALRTRLQSEGNQELSRHAAAVELLMRAHDLEPAVPDLVYHLLWDAIFAGFGLAALGLKAELTEESEQVDLAGSPDSPQETELFGELESLAESNPAFRRAVEKQLQKINEEGALALLTGDLYLELFTPEETSAAAARLGAALQFDSGDPPDDVLDRLDADIPVVFASLQEQLEAILTPERLRELRLDVALELQDLKEAESEWLPYVTQLAFDLEEDVEHAKTVLVLYLLGETRSYLYSAATTPD